VAENQRYDLIIIGAGPAGLTAGIYALRAALKTIVLEKGIPGGQVAINKPVENYPGFIEIVGFDLCEIFLEQSRRYGLEILQKEVIAVEPGTDCHTVRLADGNVLRATSLIFATGGSARRLDIPGETENLGKGVSYCATCDGYFFRDKTVVVVGGGDTALEDAVYLSKIAKKVYLVHRRDVFRGSKILQKRAFAQPRIEVILDTVVTRIIGDEEAVRAVSLDNRRTGEKRDLPADGVFIFVGFGPNSGMIPTGITLNEKGYVVTDSKCETSIPGIFAVGDLRQKYANQIVVAAADGCIAALAASHYVEAKSFDQAS
jgi:thioredoxin reductase (NADPH)